MPVRNYFIIELLLMLQKTDKPGEMPIMDNETVNIFTNATITVLETMAFVKPKPGQPRSWDDSSTAGEVVDSGSGGNNGVAAARGSGSIPSQTTPSAGKVCRSGVFGRVDANNGGYLDIGDPTDGDLDPGTRPWTVSAWVKWDGSSGENIIYNKENLYEARVSGGYVHYAWRPHWAWDGGTSFPITQDTWTYVTTVYDGHRQILYKNGQEVFSRSQSGSIGSNGNKLLIGARGSSNPRNFFGGLIDEVKIYDRALAENEIVEDMNETRDCAADTVYITTTSLPSGTLNSSYSITLTATGGTSPYGWEIVAPCSNGRATSL